MKLIPFLAVAILAKAPLFAVPIAFEGGETWVALAELFSSAGCTARFAAPRGCIHAGWRNTCALWVEVALLGCGLNTDVQRGENPGGQLRHDFVVLHHQWVKLAPGDGRLSAAVAPQQKTPAPAAAIAAWVSAGDSPELLQAVGGWLVRP
ncbi:MAG: hypothetical protein ACKV19_15765 [Verrucomicrobiales bacterium]